MRLTFLSRIGGVVTIVTTILSGTVESLVPTRRTTTTTTTTTTNLSFHRRRIVVVRDARRCDSFGRATTILHGSGTIKNNHETDNSATKVREWIGWASQPLVWVSLGSLATTGHGLPAGPWGGSIGALEGLAYLVVVATSLGGLSTTTTTNAANDNDKRQRQRQPSVVMPVTVTVQTFSRITIVLGLAVLAGVAVGKGCVPNAQPLLDYSDVLPVCPPGPQ